MGRNGRLSPAKADICWTADKSHSYSCKMYKSHPNVWFSLFSFISELILGSPLIVHIACYLQSAYEYIISIWQKSADSSRIRGQSSPSATDPTETWYSPKIRLMISCLRAALWAAWAWARWACAAASWTRISFLTAPSRPAMISITQLRTLVSLEPYSKRQLIYESVGTLIC